MGGNMGDTGKCSVKHYRTYAGISQRGTFTDARDIGEYNLRNRIRKTAAECRACYQDKPRAGKNGRRIMGS